MNLLRQIGTLIPHGNQHSLDFQVRVSLTSDLPDRLHQLRNSFQRKVLALDGNQDAVGCHEGVHRKKVQRRRAINQDVVVVVLERSEQLAEPAVSIGFLG